MLTITNKYRNNNDPTQPNPCYGLSTRIVGINPGSPAFQVMAFAATDPKTGLPALSAADNHRARRHVRHQRPGVQRDGLRL